MSVEQDFARALVHLWTRDGIAVDDPAMLAQAVTTAFARGGDGVREAAAMLTSSGVRAGWNRVLRDDRSHALAARVRPLVSGPLVDVLAGDGSICRALSAQGVTDLSATERAGDYAGYCEPRVPDGARFEPYSDGMDFDRFNASTALLCAVLHHERNPADLLDALAESAIPDWIVVENCVTPAYSRAFHEFADLFFNTCLNDIGIHCGDQHRTLGEWTSLLQAYGDVTVVADALAVPGIPFPYSLMTVRRDAAARGTDEPAVLVSRRFHF